LIEIGGTVGDMENEYLIESVRQLRHELGEQNVIFVHLVYVPFLGASQELKTRPAQFSVKDLRARGIEPDVLVVRADKPIEKKVLHKLSLMTGVEENCVIPSPTVKSIYQVPVNYQGYALGNILLQKLNLAQKPFDMSKWNILMQHIEQATVVKKIAMVGKYCTLEDAYYSLNEGLKVAGYRNDIKIQLSFVDAEKIEKD
jgi:CTP synthase